MADNYRGEYDVSKLSPEKLEAELAKADWGSPHFIALSQERQRRQLDDLKKPHRLLWWTFVVALLTLIVSVIGYWDQIARLLQALRLLP